MEGVTPMIRGLLALAAVIAVASLAATQTAGGAGMEKVGPAGVSTKTAPFDQQFIDMMAAHHMMAIDMAKMALDSAKHAELKTVARKIISAQQKEIATFHKLRKQWYGNATFKTYKMDEMMMQSMGMGGMSKMNGMMMSPRFDYAFISSMIPHHAGAITMANWEIGAGTHAQLKQVAQTIIRDQAKEIGEMIQMRTTWYGA